MIITPRAFLLTKFDTIIDLHKKCPHLLGLFSWPDFKQDKTFPFAYSSLRLLITGPVSHYFYQPMVPITVPYCMVKRLLLDRLIALPVFLLVFFFCYEHPRDFQSKVNSSYWPALKMNWKVWTPFQFININYVAVEFRVLFANMVALFWYAYLASVRK
uniref:Peroxisomal membrane protein 2 n=1 Tax=Hucho hucho TaxID=62062 RepID=A0A4W5M0R9_9TELE